MKRVSVLCLILKLAAALACVSGCGGETEPRGRSD